MLKIDVSKEALDLVTRAEAALVRLTVLADRLSAIPGAKESKPKAPKEADTAKVESEEEFDLGEDAAPPAPTLTLDDVMDAFAKYKTEKGRDKAIAVLKKFGVKSVKDIAAAKYAEVIKSMS